LERNAESARRLSGGIVLFFAYLETDSGLRSIRHEIVRLAIMMGSRRIAITIQLFARA
jgi:hypothetical protein